MTTVLPKDMNDQTIPALRLKTDGAHQISVSATAAVNSTAFDSDTQIISLYADVPVYLKFGVSDTVTATTADHYFPAGIYYDLSIGGGSAGQFSYVSALRVSDDGTLYISEKH